MSKVIIYTDGACSGNPGPGGWGVLLRYGTNTKELSGGMTGTTNNRMEMIAAIEALESLNRPVNVDLYTDSVYLKDGITKWIHIWKARNWKTANKKPVKNMDLWQRLETAMKPHKVVWYWIKGHAGHPDNEYADELARNAIPQDL